MTILKTASFVQLIQLKVGLPKMVFYPDLSLTSSPEPHSENFSVSLKKMDFVIACCEACLSKFYSHVYLLFGIFLSTFLQKV